MGNDFQNDSFRKIIAVLCVVCRTLLMSLRFIFFELDLMLFESVNRRVHSMIQTKCGKIFQKCTLYVKSFV